MDDAKPNRGVTAMLPFLLCPQCGEQIALPYRSLQGVSAVQPYWPTDSETLVLVCSVCARTSVHRESEIRWEDGENLAPAQPSTEFLIVELICDQAHCESLVVAHIQTLGNQSASDVGTAVANAIPTPTCGMGHAPKFGEVPYAIDRIGWTGKDGYLT